MSMYRAVRSFSAFKRAQIRSAQWEAREALRTQLNDLRSRRVAAEASLVERYELQMKLLSTVHQGCGPVIDWRELEATPMPPPPVTVTAKGDAAAVAVASYRPGFFAKLFGGEKKERARLAEALQAAQAEDAAATQAARAAFEEACRDVEEARELAKAVLKHDTNRFDEAMMGLGCLDELLTVALSLRIDVPRPDAAWVVVTLPPAEGVVPDEKLSLTPQLGKLSTKAMPKTEANAIYQDFVCGAALRACREVFAALPVAWCGVNVRSELQSLVTGHKEQTTLLSVLAARPIAEKLNYDALDPSEAMKNFTDRMGFKKSAGMAPVEPLTVADLPR